MKRLAIRMRGVGVAFRMQRKLLGGRFWALEHIDLDLFHGDKLGVIGRNGSGKSTLLRVLSGAMVPDRGEVVRDHGAVQLLALRLGFVQHLTGRDNAVLSGLLQGLPRRLIDASLSAIQDFSGLGEFFDQPISTYSSGMVSRLGFAVAMQMEPDILLIDETLSVGDGEFREKSRNALRERFEGRHTIVLVSHEEPTILQLCDKLLWIEHGRTQLYGSVADVLPAYREAGLKAAAEGDGRAIAGRL